MRLSAEGVDNIMKKKGRRKRKRRETRDFI